MYAEFPHRLIGMSETEARKAIADENFSWQVIERDGVKISHHKNLNLSRVNLIVEDQMILRAYIG